MTKPSFPAKHKTLSRRQAEEIRDATMRWMETKFKQERYAFFKKLVGAPWGNLTERYLIELIEKDFQETVAPQKRIKRSINQRD